MRTSFLLQKFEDSQKMDRCLGRVVSVEVHETSLDLCLHIQVCEIRLLHQVGA